MIDLFEKYSNIETKSKIFHLSDILSLINELNKQLQRKGSNMIKCSQDIKESMNKPIYWKQQLRRNNF